MDIFFDRYYERKFASRKHNGVLFFIHLVIVRCFLITTLISLLLSTFLKHLNIKQEFINYVIVSVAVVIEEQARWLFARYSNNILRSQVQFALMASMLEFVAYYERDIPIYLYGIIRIGSIFIHFLNGAICLSSFSFNYNKRILLFIFAVAFHVYMNTNGLRYIYAWVLPSMPI